MNKVLVIAVHPDDETLGCGGTLLKHKANGDAIHWLICTTLEKEHHYFSTRKKEIQDIAQAYNFNSIHQLDLQTMRVDEYSMSELVTQISAVVQKVQPNILYLPFANDVHSDHRKIFEAAYACTKSFRYPFIKKIYMMETLSETEFAPTCNNNGFIPNIFVNITPYFEKKLDIIKIYKSELAPFPFPRSLESIEALAKYRGSTCGYKYCESFMLLKETIE